MGISRQTFRKRMAIGIQGGLTPQQSYDRTRAYGNAVTEYQRATRGAPSGRGGKQRGLSSGHVGRGGGTIAEYKAYRADAAMRRAGGGGGRNSRGQLLLGAGQRSRPPSVAQLRRAEVMNDTGWV